MKMRRKFLGYANTELNKMIPDIENQNPPDCPE